MTAMTSLVDLLPAACRRELVLVTDVIDRIHIVWIPPVGATADLSRVDCEQVTGLVDAGLVQVGDVAVEVPWYGGATAHGYRLLPTEAALKRLEAELVEQPELASHVIGGAAA
jgi:hypothetical protein